MGGSESEAIVVVLVKGLQSLWEPRLHLDDKQKASLVTISDGDID